ncbi:hypothetical protein SLEP1_g58118 [Rubroshorea leprosula]|uniref:Uncharacterized protein n=1 Tax=Rubroshorea leprosula TaxID=152421 RepID=A0AAV5MPV0_9ROSI|nr:hypothetical protein SLEP1_g58118 [Rubroshorea leprosula]
MDFDCEFRILIVNPARFLGVALALLIPASGCVALPIPASGCNASTSDPC